MAWTIETVRLHLRPFSLSDVDRLHRLWNEPGVRKFLWDDEEVPRDRVESIIQKSVSLFESHRLGLWAVIHKDQDELIGFCGFWHFHEPPTLELLYGLKESYWHQGLASESSMAMLSYGFKEIGFNRIEASTDTPNQASVKLMERLGMTFWKRENSNGLDTTYSAISREAFDRRDAPTAL